MKKTEKKRGPEPKEKPRYCQCCGNYMNRGNITICFSCYQGYLTWLNENKIKVKKRSS